MRDDTYPSDVTEETELSAPPAPEERPRGRAHLRMWANMEKRLATLGSKDAEETHQEGDEDELADPRRFDDASPLPSTFRSDLAAQHQQAAAQHQQATGTSLHGKWRAIGPSYVKKGQVGGETNISGRVNGIAIASTGRIFVATANGGVWRTDHHGKPDAQGNSTWIPLMEAETELHEFDKDPTSIKSDSLACGAIAVAPTDAKRVYVGSGEPYNASDSYHGVGPIMSDDGGDHWKIESVKSGDTELKGRGFYALAVDPENADTVVAATRVGLYRRESDGHHGFHWARHKNGHFTSVVVAYNSSATAHKTIFYAAHSGGAISSSYDGATWHDAGTHFPTTDVKRIRGCCKIPHAKRLSNSRIILIWIIASLLTVNLS